MLAPVRLRRQENGRSARCFRNIGRIAPVPFARGPPVTKLLQSIFRPPDDRQTRVTTMRSLKEVIGRALNLLTWVGKTSLRFRHRLDQLEFACRRSFRRSCCSITHGSIEGVAVAALVVKQIFADWHPSRPRHQCSCRRSNLLDVSGPTPAALVENPPQSRCNLTPSNWYSCGDCAIWPASSLATSTARMRAASLAIEWLADIIIGAD